MVDVTPESRSLLIATSVLFLGYVAANWQYFFQGSFGGDVWHVTGLWEIGTLRPWPRTKWGMIGELQRLRCKVGACTRTRSQGVCTG